jgi:hypothetical protein
MTVFDQIKFVGERYQSLSTQLGRRPTNPELARALPAAGTMSHKWSDMTVLRKLLVIGQMEADVSEMYCISFDRNFNTHAQVLDIVFKNRSSPLLTLANLHARFAVRELVHDDQVSSHVMCDTLKYN